MWPILKTLLFTIIAPGTVAVYLPYRIARPKELPSFGPVEFCAGVLMVIGALIYLRCAWDFAYHGRGTPAPIDPPKILIVRGLNRYVRNPMYIGVLLVVLGEAALFRSLHLVLYAAVIWTIAHLFVLFYEEPTLQKQFGPSYDDYRRCVPRWLPRL
jgi:protein-S-isoprenylcysteine O-methyltransferase Ste14